MNISLTPELEMFVNKKVASGSYQTAIDVICDGLRLLRERDELEQEKIDDLRRELAVGIKQADEGKTAPFNEETIERVKARVRNNRR
jgi:antitoxin ParD1/3/4